MSASTVRLLAAPFGVGPTRLARRVWRSVVEDEVLARSAQLAFYFLFALFPLLILLTSLVGLFAQEGIALRDDLFGYLGAVLPRSARELVLTTVDETIVASSGGKVSFGLLATLWTAANGMGAIIDALNMAFHVRESRSWWRVKIRAVVLTVALAVLVASALALILYGGQIADAVSATFGFGATFAALLSALQWGVVLATTLGAFVLVYYFGPDVEEQNLRWVLPGALFGMALWIAASFGLRMYLHYFDSYTSTYGSLGAVMVLMTWFYLSGAAIVIGGEINSEFEHAAAEVGAPDAKLSGERRPSSARERAAA